MQVTGYYISLGNVFPRHPAYDLGALLLFLCMIEGERCGERAAGKEVKNMSGRLVCSIILFR
jgi:hypothetical protein